MRSNRQSSMVSKSFAKFTDQNGSLAKVFNTTKTYLKSQTLWRLSINMKFWCSKWMKNWVEVNFDDAHQQTSMHCLKLCVVPIHAQKHGTQIFIAQNITHKHPSFKISNASFHAKSRCFGLNCSNSVRRLPNGIFTNFHVKINRIFDQCLRPKKHWC